MAGKLNETGDQGDGGGANGVIAPEQFDKSLPNLRYDISHKMVATRAGLGWIGKTDLFVSKSSDRG